MDCEHGTCNVNKKYYRTYQKAIIMTIIKIMMIMIILILIMITIIIMIIMMIILMMIMIMKAINNQYLDWRRLINSNTDNQCVYIYIYTYIR